MYAERPLIADDTDTYKNEPIQKYGMMNWQVKHTNRILKHSLILLPETTSTTLVDLRVLFIPQMDFRLRNFPSPPPHISIGIVS